MLCWQWSVDQSQVPNNLFFMQLSSLKPFGSEDIDAPPNTIYVALLQSLSSSLTLYSSATTSMIPELPSEPFVKRCHARVLRASSCVSLSSFVNCVKTSMLPRVRIILLDLLPCVSKERLSRRYRKQNRRGTQIQKLNSTGTMKPWATSTKRPRHWEYLPLPVFVAFFVVASFVTPPGLSSPIHHCLGRSSCDRRLLSSFPPSETQNKRLPRRSPCWRSHLDQRSWCEGEDIDKKGDSTFFGRG